MKTLLFLIIFYSLNSFAVAQNSIIQIAKAEKNAFKNFEKIEQIQYPGDRKIDVIYYKLNLKLEYPPTKYLVGAVTIGAKSNYPSLTSFFLDLQDALNVDSVKMGNKKLSFTHSNAKLQITLD
ncbi:MAG TPA: peptidase M1, partial [Ignavibacteria bacterium]|nr:peptidase M1 [Ignavibacteria bacterium]